MHTNHPYLEILQVLSVDKYAVIPVEQIPFAPELRQLCESNQCGNYGKNWTCPPLVGEIDALIEKLKQYQSAIVFQKIYPLEDSFDIEGMQSAMQDFHGIIVTLSAQCRKLRLGGLILSAGGCTLCDPCAAQKGLPCPTPERALASLEAYGIQVSELAKVCGMNYINGQNTVTYFGGIFLKENL